MSAYFNFEDFYGGISEDRFERRCSMISRIVRQRAVTNKFLVYSQYLFGTVEIPWWIS